MTLPFVSVIIPVYNEEQYIEQCITSLVNQTYSKESFEILIIDGMSSDRTVEICQRLKEKNQLNLRVIQNSRRIAPTAMNIGLEHAEGEIVVRIDGHAYVDKDFLKESVQTLLDKRVACVGGPIETISENYLGQAVALAMQCPFGVGNALFRYAKKETFVDTLAFGAYQKSIFDKVGLFDEELVRNQDDEMNYRLIKSGEKILLCPRIKSYYYSRSSLKKLWKQYFQYGYWKVRVIQKHKIPSSLRQLIPPIFVLSLFSTGILSLLSKYGFILFASILISYSATSLLFSILCGVKSSLRYSFILPIIFAILHVSYGLGFLEGIIDFYLRGKGNTSRHNTISR